MSIGEMRLIFGAMIVAVIVLVIWIEKSGD